MNFDPGKNLNALVQFVSLIVFFSVMTSADSQSYVEEIPTLVVIFVGATITVLILVLMLIIGNTMKRRIRDKTNYQPGLHNIKTMQVQNTLLLKTIS